MATEPLPRAEHQPPCRPLLTQPGTRRAWVCDAVGRVAQATGPETTGEIPREVLAVFSPVFSSPESEEPSFFCPEEADLETGKARVFSCRRIPSTNPAFFLIEEMNPEAILACEQEQMVAESFGLYSWKFNLTTNRFFFSGEGKRRFFPSVSGELSYEAFYSSLTPESLERFSKGMELTINTGKPFQADLIIESADRYIWTRMEGRKSSTAGEDNWIHGFIKDQSAQKAAEDEKNKLDLWLNAGMMEFSIQDKEGSTIARWGEDRKGTAITIEKGGRNTTLYDFRNQVNYRITARTGWDPEWDRAGTPSSKQSAATVIPANPEKKGIQPSIPLDKLAFDEKFVAITQWLGQSLDCQIASMGVFDGSRFEWKAWWKSPSRFAFPVRKYEGEWLPGLEWLVDADQDLQSGLNPVWWPQDMLPFAIPESFGKGWMLLADSLDDTKRVIFALKTIDPEGVREKTRHVRNALELLRSPENRQNPAEPGPVEMLRKELALKDLLIKEMNHRAKNNLALAASLVKMEGTQTEDVATRQILRDTRKRLETLASIHEMMYRHPEQTGKVNARDYLGSLIDGLVQSFGNSILKTEIHIDETDLPVKTANTLGLLVNEIVSNAFKYALNGPDHPLLKVDFSDRGEYFKLRISDNGPGKPATEGPGTSLGSLLIEEFVRQLDASMEIDTSFGTTYLISIKKNTFEA